MGALRGQPFGVSHRVRRGQDVLKGGSPHRDVGPVVYSHSKPAKPTFDEVSNLELFYRKSSEWVYEREWRIIDSAMSADGEPTGPGGACLPFIFRPEAVKEVIYGCKCSIYYELQAVLREGRSAHVSFISETPDREKSKLTFNDFPRSSWDHQMIDTTVAMKKAGLKSD